MTANNVAALASNKYFRERAAANESCVVESFILYPLVYVPDGREPDGLANFTAGFKDQNNRRRYSKT